MLSQFTLGLLSTTLFVLPSPAQSKTTLPAQVGPYPVSISDIEFHTDRPDPWSPSPQPRRLMLTLYQPDLASRRCARPSFVSYMPDAVATLFDQYFVSRAHIGFADLQLQSCNSSSRSYLAASSRPIESAPPLVLFSPALGYTRLLYGGLLTSIAASSGYAVLSVDHTYDAAGVQFPDGTVAVGNQETQIDYNNDTSVVVNCERILPVRVQDLEDVRRAALAGRIPELGRPPASAGSKVVLFGHSLGGAAAGELISRQKKDRRAGRSILGGLNYDGSFFGSAPEEGVDVPFFLFGSRFRTLGLDVDPTWTAFYNSTRAWKTELAVSNADHRALSDLALVAKVLGVRARLTAEQYGAWLGSIDGSRLQDLMRTYTVKFFDFLLRHGRDDLLLRNGAEYPEMVFLQGSRR